MSDSVERVLRDAVARGDSHLSERDSKRVLASVGVPVTRERLAASRREAVAAARELGFPVALKGCGAMLAHKSELDLVRLALADENAVARAFDEVARRLPAGATTLVQEMVAGRRELIAGVARDPVFGPCVSLGLGGVFAEALDDAVFRIAPITRTQARAMAGELKAARLLGAVRGLPPVDLDRLAAILVALGDLALAHESIMEIDVNPLIIAVDAPIAVDALIALRRPQAG